jgi:hypothetical protein
MLIRPTGFGQNLTAAAERLAAPEVVVFDMVRDAVALGPRMTLPWPGGGRHPGRMCTSAVNAEHGSRAARPSRWTGRKTH